MVMPVRDAPKASRVSGAIFLIGLGIILLLEIPLMPWGLLLLLFSNFLSASLTKGNLHGTRLLFVWAGAILLLAVTDKTLPVLLIAAGLTLYLQK